MPRHRRLRIVILRCNLYPSPPASRPARRHGRRESNVFPAAAGVPAGGIELVYPLRGMGMFSAASDVAVDLGSVNTCIYTRGAVALTEPSVVAFNTARGGIEAI